MYIDRVKNTSKTYTIDAPGMCLVSSQRSNLLGSLPVEEEGLAVSATSTEQLSIRRETNNVYKSVVNLQKREISM